MKKFQFASAVAAALLLASCSSDAPDAPNNGGQETTPDSEMMYMSLKLAHSATRAGADGKAKEGETKISSVNLYVYDSNECIYSNVTTDIAVDKDNAAYDDAYFQVSKTAFGLLRGAAGNNLHIYVVCNADKLTGTNQLTTFNPAETALQGKELTNLPVSEITTADHFTMTGSTIVSLKVPTPADNVEENGNTRDTAWRMVEAAINVDRIAARLDFNMGSSVTGTDKAATTFNFVGATIINENNNAYLYHHGSADREGTALFYHINPSFTAPAYYKELAKTSADETATFAEMMTASETNPVYTTNGFAYVLPRTNTKNTDATVADVTYIAMEYTFSNTITEAAKNAADDNAKVMFVYDGIMIGSYADFENYVDKEGNMSRQNLIRAWYAEAKRLGANTPAEIVAKLKTFTVDQLYYYEPDTNGLYHTYFYKAISVDNSNKTNFNAITEAAKKYMILRNHVYALNVASIKGIGLPGYETPVTIDPKTYEWWVELTINVNPWVSVANEWDL